MLAYNALGPQLSSFFNNLQAPINAQVTDADFPLIGKALKSNAQAQIFSTVLKAAASTIPATLADANAAIGEIQKAFNKPAQHLSVQDIHVGANNNPNLVEFTVKGSADLGNLPFSLGIPAVNLSATGNLVSSISYEILVRANVNDTTFTYLPDASNKEIQLDTTIDLASLDARGNLGPLKVLVTKYGNLATTTTLGLDVDITSVSPSIALSPKVTGNVTANLGINANFLGFQAAPSSDPVAGLNPTLKSQFQFDWQFGSGTAYSTSDAFITKGKLSASFPKVDLDMGTTIKGLLEPVAGYIDKFASPFLKIVEPLNKTLPVVNKSTLDLVTDLLGKIGSSDAKEAAAYLKQLKFLTSIVTTVQAVSSSGVVSLGSFQLTSSNWNIQTPGQSLDKLSLTAGANAQPNGNAYNNAKSMVSNDLLTQLQNNDFHLPILESPLSAFQLLLGQTVDLVRYDAGFVVDSGPIELLNFPFQIGPIPVQVTLDLGIKFEGNLTIGFDTSGIFGASKSPADGFFLQSTDNKPLFKLTTPLTLSAGVGNRSIARLGVFGELTSSLEATLGSPNKIHFPELSTRLQSGCAIMLAGQIYFEFGGFIEYICGVSVSWSGVKLKTCRDEKSIGRFDIYDWSQGCDPNNPGQGGQAPPKPVLGEVIDGTLYLNMGPRASKRDQFTDQINESFSVSPADPNNPNNGVVIITAFGVSETQKGVQRIYADGGDGNDVIQILNLPMRSTLLGGSGDDNLQVTLGAGYLVGGDGNDTIFGGEGNDEIYGNDGNDIITLGLGNDTAYGGAGDDQISPGDNLTPSNPKSPPPNNKYIDGGDGNDNLSGGSGNDTILGGQGQDMLSGGQGNDILLGGSDFDIFIYFYDSGNQVIDGDTGGDEFQFIGGNDTDDIEIGSYRSQVTLDKTTHGNASVTMTGIFNLSLIPGDGADRIRVHDLTGTAVIDVTILLGLSPADPDPKDGEPAPLLPLTPDAFADEVILDGTNLDDLINITPLQPPTEPQIRGSIEVAGLHTRALLTTSNELDKLTVNGLAGNDRIATRQSSNLMPEVKIERDKMIQIQLDGGEGDDILSADATLLGGAGNDIFIPLAGDNVIDGGTGFDIVLVNGSEGADTISLDQTNGNLVITHTENFPGGTTSSSTNVISNVEQFNVNGLGGNDVITLRAILIPVLVDAGAGNDTVNASEVSAVAVTLLGGDGDDSLTGGSGADRVEGGTGNDTITGGPGADSLFGGDGSDLIVWNNGDGSDLIEGGTGTNALVVNGSASGDAFDVSANGARLVFKRTNLTSFVLDVAGIQQLTVNGREGGDTIHLADLTGTDLQTALFDLGSGDGAQDIVTLDGRQIADQVAISQAAGGGVDVDGLPVRVSIRSSSATNDVLQVRGLGGDDRIEAFAGSEAEIGLQLEGGLGNDLLIGDGTLLGSAGDDTLFGGAAGDVLLGGAGNDSISGGAGNDLILGDADGTGVGATFTIVAISSGHGADTLDGGAGNDTINGDAGDDLIRGQDGNDLIGPIVIGLVSFGEAGNDTIDGGAGNDTIDGDAGDDSILGGDGNDLLLGHAGNDTIRGGGGNDSISGGDGNDSIFGDAGDDTIHGDAGNDSISGGDGNDLIFGDAGNDSIVGDAGNDYISGGVGNDSIDGGTGNDTIFGEDGDDSILGGDGNDSISGGVGNDTIDGGTGNDTIFGDAGDDSILGGDGNDSLSGDTGNDTIRGGSGADSIRGGDGHDSIFGDAGDDTIHGDAGNDILFGGDGDDQIFGEDGNDFIIGDAGNDFIAGGAGNDSLEGAAGNDTIVGGAGSDRISGGDNDDLLLGDANALGNTILVTIASGQGNDTIDGGAGNDTINGDAGDDSLFGGDGDDLIAPLTIGLLFFSEDGNDAIDAGAGNDTVHAGNGNDLVIGGSGNDLLFGDAGNDTIHGGSGADSILGGDGNDSLYGDEDGDLLLGEAGNDSIRGGSGADTILGGDGDDRLFGDDGNDLLLADAGNDSLEGGAGNDTMLGGDGNDTLAGNGGNDWLDGGAGNDLAYGGDGDDTVIGQAGDDVLYGEGGNDLILGGDGNDAMNGGDGNDQLWGGAGNDTIAGGSGNDSLVGGDGDDAMNGEDGDDLIFGENGNDSILGGLGNDTLFGGEGNDYLHGGTGIPNIPHTVRDPSLPNDGDDVLVGGNGADSLDGGNGNNILDAGDDGIAETVLAGTGNDIAFGHWDHDGNRDVFGLDGGYNRVYVRGEIHDVTPPAPSTTPVTFVVSIQPPSGQYVVQPGDPKDSFYDPLPARARLRFNNHPAVVLGVNPFAGRSVGLSNFATNRVRQNH